MMSDDEGADSLSAERLGYKEKHADDRGSTKCLDCIFNQIR